MEKRGEVQKGFLVIVFILLGVAVLASYLNTDSTGYASGSLRGSSGIVSPLNPPDNNCGCSSKDPPETKTTHYQCPVTGLRGTRTCVSVCVKGLHSCTPVWERQSSTVTVDGNTRTTVEKLLDGNWQVKSCTTNCNR